MDRINSEDGAKLVGLQVDEFRAHVDESMTAKGIPRADSIQRQAILPILVMILGPRARKFR